MAKTSYLTITAGQEDLFRKTLTQNDRFYFSRVVRADTLLSRQRIRGVTQRSLLSQVSAAWALLSAPEKQAWSDAGAECNLNGWRLYVKDWCLRYKNAMPGITTPSTWQQAWVGALKLSGAATEIKIAQLHPHFYWTSHKISGRKGMYEPVRVTEDFALPLKISLNYKSILTANGANPYARFYADVWHSYQGRDLHTELACDLDLLSNWKNVEATLSSVLGYIVSYNLYIHLHDLSGELYVDNIYSEHSAQNWVRDPFCQNIDITFTRAFYQIPKNWVALILPNGAEYDSIYYWLSWPLETEIAILADCYLGLALFGNEI